MKDNQSLIQSTYYIHGMHCASCEILIEKKIIKELTVNMVDANLSKNVVIVEHQPDDQISAKYLSKIFEADHYRFSDTPFHKNTRIATDSYCAVSKPSNPLSALFTAGLIIIGFLLLNKSGLTSLVSVNTTSTLPIFLVFGLLAGFSSCAALVGGIILSVSRQWVGNYGNSDSTLQKLQPHFLFNGGRVLGYAFFGALLGYVGNFFRLSPLFTATLVIAVSGLMIMLGLQMLGVKALASFQIRLPKSLTGHIADESNFQSRFAPALMGALTFFLPCGFTITAQALALASGSPATGALIMAFFALGTIPGLLAIGYSSVKFQSNPQTSTSFSAIAGYLVLFFALFNINAQLSVVGLPNLSDAFATNSSYSKTVGSTGELAPIVNGQQIIKMDASSSGYTPNRFKIRANTPTRWEVATNNISGCTNAIISRGLFDGQIDLVDGTTSVKEFTSPKPGIYKFSCWMGMVSGTIEVVDSSGSTGTAVNTCQYQVEMSAFSQSRNVLFS